MKTAISRYSLFIYPVSRCYTGRAVPPGRIAPNVLININICWQIVVYYFFQPKSSNCPTNSEQIFSHYWRFKFCNSFVNQRSRHSHTFRATASSIDKIDTFVDTSVIFAMATLCPAFRAMTLEDRAAVPTPPSVKRRATAEWSDSVVPYAAGLGSSRRRATEEPDCGVVLCSAGRQNRRRERASREERLGDIKAPTRPNQTKLQKRKRLACPAQLEAADATATIFLETDMRRQRNGPGGKFELQERTKRNRRNVKT